MMIARPIVTAHIRYAMVTDMARIMSIETQSFGDPWTEAKFLEEKKRGSVHIVVSETELGHVIGFCVYELHKNRVHILNLAVDASRRYHGVGTSMIDRLLERLNPGGRVRMMVEVAETNLDAQLFFKKMKFHCYAVLHEFYDDQDAYAFQLKIAEVPK